ncbi:hypothetical protein [Oryzomonas rubra]|uniref:Uncharacterized protein n=1 Tax=Oryzomonas rubra TaxID=2509454 RepID=A0A5A9X5B2_9BACT|nr:hypothetical protein [Oryzomonas rubra]KAA0888342.1 hypothetical protein ET418_16550 [Oryzomonas rubra]
MTCLSHASLSYADSLVITYRSGKTQTILLDDRSSSIASQKYLSDGTPTASNTPAMTEPHTPPAVQGRPEGAEPAAKPGVQKSGFHFKWAEPVPAQ